MFGLHVDWQEMLASNADLRSATPGAIAREHCSAIRIFPIWPHPCRGWTCLCDSKGAIGLWKINENERIIKKFEDHVYSQAGTRMTGISFDRGPSRGSWEYMQRLGNIFSSDHWTTDELSQWTRVNVKCVFCTHACMCACLRARVGVGFRASVYACLHSCVDICICACTSV